MKQKNLTKQEKKIENALLKGEYINIPSNDFDSIAAAIKERRKDAVLNIRVNKNDLKNIKKKAKQIGIKYQSFLSELIHRFAA